MKRITTALVVCAMSAALAGPARAADDPWSKVEDAVKKRGSPVVFVVLVAAADADDVKHVTERLGDKTLAKAVKEGLLAVRLEPGDAEGAGKLGVPTGKKEKFFVLDGYGIVTSQHEAAPASADGFARLVKDAHDATAKKKKIEKALDGAVNKGEAALKRGDPKSACELFSPILEYKETIPCPAVTAAQKHLDELAGKGSDLVSKARAAIGKKEFSVAQKLLTEAANDYPLPAIQDDVKKAREELALAEDRQSKGY